MSSADDRSFFVGWSGRTGRPLGWFLALAAGGVLAGLLLLAVALGGSADDPAGPRFARLPDSPATMPAGDQTLRGVLDPWPYPLLHLPPEPGHPRGRAILLSGEGKRGIADDAAALAEQVVEARGYLLRRGTIEMLQLGEALRPIGAAPTAIPAEPLGRWRITGEVCDGKCAGGAMRPGTGIAHRACATLCITGDIPPVFVSTAPVAGGAFLLLADRAGRAAPAAWRELIGVRATLEGEVERRGDLLVFRAEVP